MKGFRPALATNLGVLYATDCFNLFAALKNDSVDCVFADPPFNLGKDYGRGAVKDALGRRDYLKWSFAWIDECVRLLKPGGALFVYILPSWGYHLASHMEERGMLFRHWVAMSMKGTFPRGRKLYPAHYALLYFSKGEPKTFNDMLAAYGDRGLRPGLRRLGPHVLRPRGRAGLLARARGQDAIFVTALGRSAGAGHVEASGLRGAPPTR